MRRLEGGDWKGASNGNSLVAYPTSSPVLKTSGSCEGVTYFNFATGTQLRMKQP